jgi:hypothetical protein
VILAVVAVRVFAKIFVKYPVTVFNRLVKKLVDVAEVNVGVSVNEYVTSPFEVVATVKLLFVDDARNVYRLAIDVVAIIPLIFVVTTPLEAAIVFELIMLEVALTPLIDEVNMFTAEERVFELMKLPVVVATFPFTIEVNVNVFVLVETVKLLLVLDATRFVRSVLVATPFTEVVRVVPFVEIPFEDITEVVATTPLTVLVSTFPVTDCVNELMMLATVEVIPLMIVCRTFPVEVAIEVLMIDDVDISPLTSEVRVFVAEERELVVTGRSPVIEVVATTPLIFDERTPPA